MPPTNPQISLVPDSDPETTDTEPSTEWSSSMGMWCTSTKLVYRAMQAVEHQVKAEKKDFAERLGEATKACNAELEGEVPGKLDPLKKWAARVVGYHSTWRKTLDEKAAALGKRKQQLADLKAAFAELMDANPQSEQLGLSFGAEKNGGPGWADSTISIVNGLAREAHHLERDRVDRDTSLPWRQALVVAEPIGRGARRFTCAQVAASAGFVVDHKGLLELLGELLCHQARQDVGGAPCGEGHDHFDGFVRVALSECRRSGQSGPGQQAPAACEAPHAAHAQPGKTDHLVSLQNSVPTLEWSGAPGSSGPVQVL